MLREIELRERNISFTRIKRNTNSDVQANVVRNITSLFQISHRRGMSNANIYFTLQLDSYLYMVASMSLVIDENYR